jgi:hypothetical protein
MQRAAVAWALAAVLACALALPAVWWEPLHVDEWVTLSVAPQSVGEIVDQIFVRKGGSPVHFFLEHFFLEWPGGLEGLRIPSLVAFALALPAAGLLARELAGPRESILLPIVLASAPLAVELATFGRMYGLLLAAFLWATWAALRAARRGTWALAWAAVALGALVYLHPLAPLYAVPALVGAAFLARVGPMTLVWTGVGFVGATLPYWAHSLWRLRERYYVGYGGSERLEATSGRSVPEESLLALSAGPGTGALLFAVVAVVGAVALWRRGRRRETAVLVAWVLVPLVFFTVVPAGDVAAGGTRFYPRYLLPVLPSFLLLVTAGCLAAPRLVAAGLAALVLGLHAGDDWDRLVRLRALQLSDAVAMVRSLGSGGVLLPAQGRGTTGRPAYLLDELVELEVPSVRRAGPGRAVILIGGSPAFLDQAERRLPTGSRAERISLRLLVVTRVSNPRIGDLARSAYSRQPEVARSDPAARDLQPRDRALLPHSGRRFGAHAGRLQGSRSSSPACPCQRGSSAGSEWSAFGRREVRRHRGCTQSDQGCESVRAP